MNKFQVFPLFPTPVGYFTLPREFKAAEINFIKNQNKIPNTGNIRSENGYVLKSKKMVSIKTFLETCVKAYYENVHKPKESEIYITQSWLNYSDQNQYHHRHGHPNSFISGVFYINAVAGKDSIVFTRDEEFNRLQPNSKEFNHFNSFSWTMPVKTGDLYIFPSCLQHFVSPVNSGEQRISLSFNTYLKGKFGNQVSSTELILE